MCGTDKTWNFILNVSLVRYKLRDSRLTNATAIGPSPNHLLTCGRTHAHLRVGTDNNNNVTYPEFAWLIRRLLDLIIEFIGPLYNRLQQFTNHYLIRRHLLRLDTSDFWSHFTTPLFRRTPSRLLIVSLLGTDPTENTVFCCQECVFIGPLPGSGCPILQRVYFGNVFTDPLPSNGHMSQYIQVCDRYVPETIMTNVMACDRYAYIEAM
jgi:hypothetical protein